MALSVTDFATKIKSKYPQYANVDDNTLTQKIVAKYPQYKDQVDFGQPKSQGFDLGKTIGHGLDMAINPAGYMARQTALSDQPQSVKDQINAQYDVPKNIDTAAQFVTESTVKPIAKGAATVSIGSAKSLYDRLNAIAQGKSDAEIDKEASKPLNLPFVGQVNPNANTPMQNVGLAADVGSGYMNMMTPYQSLRGAIGRGALQSGAKEMEYNPNATPLSIGANAAVGGAISGISYGVPKFWDKAKKKLAEMRGQAAGLKSDTIKTLEDAKTGDQAVDMLGDANAAKLNPANYDDPMQQVGQKKLKPAVEKVIQQNKQLSKDFVATLKSSDARFTTKDDYKAFVESLKEIGGKVKGGEVIFDGTSPITSQADISTVNKVLADLKRFSTKELSAEKYNDVIRRITGYTDFSSTQLAPINTITDKLVKGARFNMNDKLKRAIPEASDTLEQMAKNHDIIDFFNPKLGDNSSSATTLRNLFSPAQKDALRPNLQQLERTAKIDIINPTRAAKAAMDIVGDTTGENLIQGVSSPKGALLEGLRRFVFNPEAAAKGIVRNARLQPIQQGVFANRGIVPQAIMGLMRGKRLP